jgi:biopolymer transport protein ExbD
MPLNIQRRPGRLSLTPLIDCVFILLVFFMLQTNFLRPQAIEFTKAAGGSGIVSEMTTISVELHANGSVWLNGSQSDMEKLRASAANIITPDNTRVILALDPDVVLQRAVDVMNLFNQYGILNIAMSAALEFD